MLKTPLLFLCNIFTRNMFSGQERSNEASLPSSWRFPSGSAGGRAEVKCVEEPMGKTPVNDEVQIESGTHKQQPQLLSSKGKF